MLPLRLFFIPPLGGEFYSGNPWNVLYGSLHTIMRCSSGYHQRRKNRSRSTRARVPHHYTQTTGHGWFLTQRRAQRDLHRDGTSDFTPIVDACSSSRFNVKIKCWILPNTVVIEGTFNGISIQVTRWDWGTGDHGPGDFFAISGSRALIIECEGSVDFINSGDHGRTSSPKRLVNTPLFLATARRIRGGVIAIGRTKYFAR